MRGICTDVSGQAGILTTGKIYEGVIDHEKYFLITNDCGFNAEYLCSRFDFAVDKIKLIQYNWFYTQGGESYLEYKVGAGGVLRIIEVDKKCYDVYFSDGEVKRIFNPNLVVFGGG